MLIEVIATNLEEALQAECYGANRLELIHSFSDGGLSPGLLLAKEVCSAVKIPVNVMVRPHADSFVYSSNDMLAIAREIEFLATQTKANAIVYGSLTKVGEINFKQLEIVIKHLTGSGVGLTFHRAIDVSHDVLEAYRELQNYGKSVSRVLSSAGHPSAPAGARVLLQMQQLHRSNGAILLAGVGITPENAAELIKASLVSEIHLGAGLRRDNVLQVELFQSLLENIKDLPRAL